MCIGSVLFLSQIQILESMVVILFNILLYFYETLNTQSFNFVQCIMFFVISTVQSKGFHCFMHIFGTVLELVVFHGDLDVCFLLEAVTSHPNDNLQFLLLLSSLLLRSLIYDFQSYASGVLWFKLVFPKQIL